LHQDVRLCEGLQSLKRQNLVDDLARPTHLSHSCWQERPLIWIASLCEGEWNRRTCTSSFLTGVAEHRALHHRSLCVASHSTEYRRRARSARPTDGTGTLEVCSALRFRNAKEDVGPRLRRDWLYFERGLR
jgi:hypothetical protein